MAIYTCPKCGNKFYLDNNDIKSADFQREFHCSSCGAGYNGNAGDAISQFDDTTEQQSTNIAFTRTCEDTSSAVGSAIKVLSVIVLVLCVIGSIVAFNESVVIGLVILIVSVLSCLLSYGVGEIICILKDIKNKLK